MKIAGVIAEYNPFHRGHAWHLSQTRARLGCDYVVVCMDGHFTQRGEPACLSKWTRARMALACGADAVFELPSLFAVRPADVFALGGVAILGGLGADALSFGCETEDLTLLRRMARLLDDEPEELSERIKSRLSSGMSFAKARGEAVGEWLGVDPEALNQPNLILGVEYLRAIERLCPQVEALAIRRTGDYHGEALGEYASAGAIRAAFERGDAEAALACIPEAARRYAARPDRMHAMDDLLLYRLREQTPEQLAELPDMSEGLEHRLYRLCRTHSDREALLEALKCKRYTRARLSRLLTHALLGLKRTEVGKNRLPSYARLLGMRESAQPLLAELKRRARLPIVSDPAKLRENDCFQFECHATDLWSLLHDLPEERLPGREYTEKFIIVP